MTKTNFAVAAVLMVAASCSTPSDSYTVSGNIAGIPDGTELYLVLRSHIGNDTVGSATVSNGRFTFEGQAPEPRLVSLIVKDSYGAYSFMLENAQIGLTGSAEASDTDSGTKYYSFDGVAVTGSPMTDTLAVKNAARARLDSAFVAYQKEYEPFMAKIQEARMADNKAALDSLYASDDYRNMSGRESELFRGLDEAFARTVAENKDSFWGPLMMIYQTSYLNADQREMYESLSDEAKESYYGKEVYQELYPIGKIGDKLPEFTATTADGKEISLADICKGKKLVLLDFWASWCRPCRAEIPNLKKIYEAYADKGFDILSVSIDKEEGPWLKAVENEGLQWTNVRDSDASIAGKYKVSAVPTMYLIDGNGCLVGENLRGEALAAKVAEILD